MATSPITLTLMVLILPRVTLIEELGFFPEMPEYLFERAFRIFAVASSMVSPESCMGPTCSMLIFPSGVMVLVKLASFNPHISMMTSSPGPS